MPAKVIIIDDVELNSVMLEAMVRRQNPCETLCFTDAKRALDWCEANQPDLILLDYVMPGMNGAQFLTALRQLDHCRSVPTLVITADQDRSTLLQALDAGANDFIRKPVDAIEFQTRVRNALQLGGALSQLRYLATTDGLTELLNRRTFMKRLDDENDRAERYGQPLSVAIIDVDHFKRVNDRFGHATGDIVLVAVADACRTVLRKPDVIGRIGGEEFGIILPATTAAAAEIAAERVRSAIAGLALAPLGDAGSLTVSVGVATFAAGMSSKTLLSLADAALYDAKSAGRNQVVAATERHIV